MEIRDQALLCLTNIRNHIPELCRELNIRANPYNDAAVLLEIRDSMHASPENFGSYQTLQYLINVRLNFVNMAYGDGGITHQDLLMLSNVQSLFGHNVDEQSSPSSSHQSENQEVHASASSSHIISSVSSFLSHAYTAVGTTLTRALHITRSSTQVVPTDEEEADVEAACQLAENATDAQSPEHGVDNLASATENITTIASGDNWVIIGHIAPEHSC